MRRYAIHTLNISLLIIIVIGVPAATSIRLGSIQISSRPANETVTLAALLITAIFNGFASIALAPKSGEKILWRNWAITAAGLLGFYLALYAKFVHFQWLKQGLLWLKSLL
ncbi:MAG: hypothetical protein M2R45_00531 [Verrucomicrobia subdivision 3 bacterium]|nr:hypothetical protein [Limisphaerales bacterium]MCS1413591.1 hypothetical protein [Limisphaerales bacterium]